MQTKGRTISGQGPRARAVAGRELSVPEATRLLRFQCTRTVYRLADAGRIRLRETARGRVIDRKELQHAQVLTVGQVAKRAGCSVRTVLRRVEAGLIEPHREWGRATRFSLADVREIRASLRLKRR